MSYPSLDSTTVLFSLVTLKTFLTDPETVNSSWWDQIKGDRLSHYDFALDSNYSTQKISDINQKLIQDIQTILLEQPFSSHFNAAPPSVLGDIHIQLGSSYLQLGNTNERATRLSLLFKKMAYRDYLLEPYNDSIKPYFSLDFKNTALLTHLFNGFSVDNQNTILKVIPTYKTEIQHLIEHAFLKQKTTHSVGRNHKVL